MDKEDIKRLAENPEHIAGIYNYCDRWCERCPFTSRCLNFTLEDEKDADPETRDIRNKAFWDNLAETLQATLDLLRETTEEYSFDLDALDTEEEAKEQRLEEELAKNHECCRAAKAYAEMVDNWFDSARDLFGQEEGEPSLEKRFDIPNVSPLREVTSLEDAVQVIRRYQHLIYTKLMRAVRGELRERPDILDEFSKDSDGSAKVALIAIDRSIAAWGEIRNVFPIRERDILDLIAQLDSLRRKVENEFPDARAFIRPGFDKIELSS